MTLTDFFRYLATDQRTVTLSTQLADAYRLQHGPAPQPTPNPSGPR